LETLFFHLVRDWQFIQRDELWTALVTYQFLFSYSVILATALSISQLRKRAGIGRSVTVIDESWAGQSSWDMLIVFAA
jgi:hypothetical protein